jgi:hypothetical protein
LDGPLGEVGDEGKNKKKKKKRRKNKGNPSNYDMNIKTQLRALVLLLNKKNREQEVRFAALSEAPHHALAMTSPQL